MNIKNMIQQYEVTDPQDINLIMTADRLSPIEWMLVDNLQQQAHQEGTLRILHDIQSALYHREEAMMGMI